MTSVRAIAKYGLTRNDVLPGSDCAQAMGRFLFIDGLRGVAAVGVLLYHVYAHASLMGATLRVPRLLLERGALGVQVFFLISGFVIAHSLRGVRLTAGNGAMFIVRRHVRLDPTYWAALAAAAAAALLAKRHTLGGTQFVSNMFYLQWILRYPALLGVSWTLCLEVQFYLLFVLVIAVVQLIGSRSKQPARTRVEDRISTFAIISLFVFSLILRTELYRRGNAGEPPWFVYDWYLFGLGIIVYWAWRGRIGARAATSSIILVLICGLWVGQERMIAGATTGAVIYIAARRDRLGEWLSRPAFQYLGAISYSLYLIHFGVVTRVLNFGLHRTGLSTLSVAAWSVVAAAGSVAVAHALHVAVERPTMRLAAKLRKGRPIAVPSVGQCESVNVQKVVCAAGI